MKKRYMIPALLACSGFCMAGTASVATTPDRQRRKSVSLRRRSGCGRG